MARSVQAKWLGLIEGSLLAEAVPGAEVVSHFDFGNKGRLYLQLGLHTYATVEFEFQGQSAQVSLSGPAVEALCLVDRPPEYRWEEKHRRAAWYVLKYTDGDRLAGFLDLCEKAGLMAAVVIADHQ